MRHHRHAPALLALLALACAAQPTTGEPGASDERRPAQPFALTLAGQPVQFGGSWEYSDERRGNFDLDPARARDRRVREHELKVEARLPLDAHTQLFVQAIGLHETRRTQGSPRDVRRTLERGQMWWQRERLSGSPWSLQVGRVEWLDRRAWWWDERLDAVRVRYAGEHWRLDTGLAHELARKTSAEHGVAPAARGVTRWLGQATWPWAPRHALDAFWLVHHDASAHPAPLATAASEDDTDPSDLRARWLGLRASGEQRWPGGTRLAYWADAARLAGRERLTAFNERADGSFIAGATASHRVRGSAFDIGATAALGVPLRPSLTLGYARGSPGFRQTGLQENKSRLAGVKRWQRYGELLQPELANLKVATVSTGMRPGQNTSVELAAHRYRQVRAADTVPGARLTTRPLGGSRSLGREVDLLVAVRESQRVEFLFKASRFKPGAAFAADRRAAARAVEAGISVNF